MIQVLLLDVAPDPVGFGALLAVILLVMGFIVLLAVGLVLFLWYRKRSMRGLEMIRPDILPHRAHSDEQTEPTVNVRPIGY